MAAKRAAAKSVRQDRVVSAAPAGRIAADAVMEEARRAGLLDGEKTEHVSFRAPRALVEAAKRETGVSSPTELGLLALAMLAQRDPFVELMRKTRGALGAGHKLDY